MFGIKKQYTPSASNNNNLQKNVSKELTAAIYRLEKGKFNSALDKVTVGNCIKKLKDLNDTLSNSFGTGKEDISRIAETISKQIQKVTEVANQDLTNRFEDAVGELGESIEFWIDVNMGYVSSDEFGANKDEPKNRAIEKLSKKVEEYEKMEKDLKLRSVKISKDIEKYSGDVEEYKRQIKEEYLKPNANAIKIKQVYNSINSTQSIIINTTKRQEYYLSCVSLLSTLCANVRNMLEDASYSKTILADVTVYLENDAVANVFDKPGEVCKILEDMNSRIDEVMKNNKIPIPTPLDDSLTIDPVNATSDLPPQIDDFIKGLFAEEEQIKGLEELKVSEITNKK